MAIPGIKNLSEKKQNRTKNYGSTPKQFHDAKIKIKCTENVTRIHYVKAMQRNIKKIKNILNKKIQKKL